MPAQLVAIADDLTGATDLAGGLVRAGLPCRLVVGVPPAPLHDGDVGEAVVVALATRSAPPPVAVDQTRQALAAVPDRAWTYVKYCSTFDSTPAGNIGPVSDTVAAEVGADLVVHCPAFPANGRTVYHGSCSSTAYRSPRRAWRGIR